MYRIFIVEDDRTIGNKVKEHMAAWGLEVYLAQDLRAVFEEFKRVQPHLVVMDVGLPFYNGYHWCTEIRKVSKVPVLFLSSASDNLNIVMAMNMGGDDFVAKPFDMDVLMAKINALIRRSYDFANRASTLEYGGISLNLDDAVVLCGERSGELTKNEFRILQELMEKHGKIVSRERLMEKLWDTDSFVDENTLSVNVNRLRRKLGELGAADLIKTKKGMGYIIE